VARALLDRGYRNVHPIIGGFNLWQQQGYPTQPKQAATQAI
jgi:rhodanese-related sulfurtransferase